LKAFLIGLGSLLITLLLLQLVRIEIPTPPTTTASDEIVAPTEVMALLKKSCYDCHSNHTNWPWYSDIAPISFEVRGHVRDGRRWLNFNIWNQYDQKKQQERYKGIIKSIDRKMPIPAYIMAHKETKLSPTDKNMIKEWARSKIIDE